jgi:hypothetical protein
VRERERFYSYVVKVNLWRFNDFTNISPELLNYYIFSPFFQTTETVKCVIRGKFASVRIFEIKLKYLESFILYSWLQPVSELDIYYTEGVGLFSPRIHFLTLIKYSCHLLNVIQHWIVVTLINPMQRAEWFFPLHHNLIIHTASL